MRRLTDDEFWRSVPLAVRSPIEEQMAVALLQRAWGTGARVAFMGDGWIWERNSDGRRLRELVTIAAQPEICGLRPDFAVMAVVAVAPAALRHVGVLVECDGHEFHERTKEQAQRDRRRDRRLAKAGHTVLRFTGSEIHRNADACAVDALETLLERMRPLLREREGALLDEATGRVRDAGAW